MVTNTQSQETGLLPKLEVFREDIPRAAQYLIQTAYYSSAYYAVWM